MNNRTTADIVRDALRSMVKRGEAYWKYDSVIKKWRIKVIV